MKIGLIPRPDREDALDMAASLKRILDEKGHTAEDGVSPDHDMEIVIGGDGTILRAVKSMGKWQNPVLGINMGGVGFLADIEPGDAKDYIKEWLGDTIDFEERIRINVRNGGKQPFATALNEIAILHNEGGDLLTFKIIIDNIEVQEFKADGLIVSTPTGSTAYAMSAGGSIVDPLIHDGFLVVPVAPYLLSSRPQLVSTKRTLEIEVAEGDDAIIVVDGHRNGKVNTLVPVEIRVDPNPARFVNIGLNFFKKVGDKLRR
jgi:NAD+ kinase